MPIFYRGAGIGTYWHTNNAVGNGFTSRVPSSQIPHSINQLMNHIARGTTYSPYISLTRSYGVAWSYAVFLGRRQPTPHNPAYVYQIEINDPPPSGLQIFNPVREVANAVPKPLSSAPPYQHNGLPNFLLGVTDPIRMRRFLTIPALQPPPGGGAPQPSNLTLELETLVRALRDAEILVVEHIPPPCVLNRYPVW